MKRLSIYYEHKTIFTKKEIGYENGSVLLCAIKAF